MSQLLIGCLIIGVTLFYCFAIMLGIWFGHYENRIKIIDLENENNQLMQQILILSRIKPGPKENEISTGEGTTLEAVKTR